MRRLAIAIALCGCGDDGATSDSDPTTSSSTGGAESEASTAMLDSSSGGVASSGSVDESGSTGEAVDEPPPCGSARYAWAALVPGPGEADHDAELASVADRYDRLSAVLAGYPHGMSADMRIAIDDTTARDAIATFVESGEWDFAEATGLDVPDVVAEFRKATGAYAGVALAADAYRYGTLRDQGAACEDIDRARQQLLVAMQGLERAIVITGEPGLIARAYARKDLPGDGESPTTPLFDANGDPLPPEKNNGTWREDNSGTLPDWVWEDSCSRDQFEGWILGMAAAWEVIEHDGEIPDDVKASLQAHAKDIALQLATVRPSGYDLEIWDPDGRPTFHGYLHENNIEGNYGGFVNGMHALMALGIVGALAYTADDPDVDTYLHDELIGRRNLPGKATTLFIDFGPGTNFSNYNMAFAAGWMALRWVDDENAREEVVETIAYLYDNGGDRQPREQGQTLFDFVYAASTLPPDDAALASGLATLVAYPQPPAYDVAVDQCDAEEIAAASCTLADGTVVELLGAVGHNDEVIAEPPIAMGSRPPSNYHWRSNPYTVNGGGDGSGLAGPADFRFAYWLGRFTRRR